MTRGSFLTGIVGKTVDRIYEVDYNKDRAEDNYLPFCFLIVFRDYDHYLDIVGDIDGMHINLLLVEEELLEARLEEWDQRAYDLLWQPYPVAAGTPLGTLLGKTIHRVEYAVDKESFVINGTVLEGDRELFTGVRLHHDAGVLTIFERGPGLYATTDPAAAPEFEETYDWYAAQPS